MNENEARSIADEGFGFIASDPELAGLRAMAARPEFALFVLDFLLEFDQRVVDFARAANIRPERVQMARGVLGGYEF